MNIQDILQALPSKGTIASAIGLAGLILVISHPAAGCTTPSFAAATNFEVGDGPASVAVGDFNGDGHLDLAVANSGDNTGPGTTVSILLGTGSGSFGAATPFDVGEAPVAVAVGDFNGDGHLDLVTANSGDTIQTGTTVSILLGDGGGSFGAATSFEVGRSPASVAVGDFNRDGHLDLAVVNEFDNNVSILLGDGNGGFSAATAFNVGIEPRSVAIGDFNGDGYLDLATANSGDKTASILLGDGSGNFGAATSYDVAESPISVAVGDFNGDDHLDLAVANSGGDTVSILLNTGTGSLEAASPFGSAKNLASVAVGDFNGDGYLDLATASRGDNALVILLGTGTGSFEEAIPFTVGTEPVSVAVGDFTGDGYFDIATANSVDNTVSVLLNGCSATPMTTPTPSATPLATATPSATATPAGNACVGDCDGNAKVAVNEIITLVNIALGTVESSVCPSGIPSGEDVTISLIVQAVNHALDGCAG